MDGTLSKMAAVAVNQMSLDWRGNERRILEAFDAALAEGVTLLVYPELAICGGGCEDALWFPVTRRQSWRILRNLAQRTDGTGVTVVIGLPVEYDGRLYDAAAICGDGEIQGIVPKLWFSDSPSCYDLRWFTTIPPDDAATIDGVPFGVGIPLVCGNDEQRFSLRILFGDDPEPVTMEDVAPTIWAVPLADGFEFGSFYRRAESLKSLSETYGNAIFIAANPLGNAAGATIYDGGNLIVTNGRILVAAERFVYREWNLSTFPMEMCARTLPSVGRRSPRNSSADAISCGLDTASVDLTQMEDSTVVSEPVDARVDFTAKCEEFAQAVALGLWDYLRRTRSKGFVLSLSGGADSAAIACLVEMGLGLAFATLGADRFFPQLGISLPTSYQDRADRMVQRLLHTVYQGSQNSSATTHDAAQRLANGLGAIFSELPIDEFVRGYRTAVESMIDRELMWETDDLALQNIQARVRVPGVWMLANVKDALLLSTGNRSEAAVGYATMDGDSCGCLSPIAGIDKAFLRKFLVWLRDTGPANWRAVPELDGVLSMVPTAELRPTQYSQTDEDDLMPYEVLNTIEVAAIRDRLSFDEIIPILKEKYPELTDAQIDEWLRRFFRLWRTNQWKRERFATGFHVDDHDLSPKGWCRFPVLSGN